MKKRGCFIAFAVIVGLVLFLVFMQMPSGGLSGKRLVISKETTVLTGPVRDDGGIDYMAVINGRLAEGVTPANNAVVELLRVIPESPDTAARESWRDQMVLALGLEKYPEPCELIDPWVELREKLIDKTADIEVQIAMEDRLEKMAEMVLEPWTAETFPEWALALDQQHEALDIVVEASKRKNFYCPLVGFGGDTPILVDVPMDVITSIRFIARQLRCRAMFALGNGDIPRAIEDIKSIRRLACLASWSAITLEKLVAIVVFDIAAGAEELLISSGKLSRDQLLDYLAFQSAHQLVSDVSERLDKAERFFLLDLIQSVQLYGVDSALRTYGLQQPVLSSRLSRFATDLSNLAEAMKVANHWMDQYVEGTRPATFQERQRNIEKLDEELREMEVNITKPHRMILSLVSGPKSRGQFVGKVAVLLWLPGVRQLIDSEARVAILDDLVFAGGLLELYRIDHDRYPDSLDALLPQYCQSIPLDPFTETPFTYHKTDTGFLLYSIGVDETDNGGRRKMETAEQWQYDVRFGVGDSPEWEVDSPLDREKKSRELELRQTEREAKRIRNRKEKAGKWPRRSDKKQPAK